MSDWVKRSEKDFHEETKPRVEEARPGRTDGQTGKRGREVPKRPLTSGSTAWGGLAGGMPSTDDFYSTLLRLFAQALPRPLPAPPLRPRDGGAIVRLIVSKGICRNTALGLCGLTHTFTITMTLQGESVCEHTQTLWCLSVCEYTL